MTEIGPVRAGQTTTGKWAVFLNGLLLTWRSDWSELDAKVCALEINRGIERIYKRSQLAVKMLGILDGYFKAKTRQEKYSVETRFKTWVADFQKTTGGTLGDQ